MVVPDDLRPASSLLRQGGNKRTGCLAAASRAQKEPRRHASLSGASQAHRHGSSGRRRVVVVTRTNAAVPSAWS